MEELRIFVSSPGDVGAERVRAERVIERLQAEFARRVRLAPFIWEHEPQLATQDYQANIPPTSEFDIVICILWSRLGTLLSDAYRRADGSRYASGTEFEFETAANAPAASRPKLLVYRNLQEPTFPHDAEARRKRMAQYDALSEFLNRWFVNADASFKKALTTHQSLTEFEDQLEDHLRALIKKAAPPRDLPPEEWVEVDSWTQGSPFRGLKPFDIKHEKIFFGRTKAIDGVLHLLRAQAHAGRAMAIVAGASGSGKSSLMRAGVIPLLMRPGVIEGVGVWRRAICRPADPGGDVFDVLAAALTAEGALPEVAQAGASAGKLAAALRDAPEGVPLSINLALTAASATAQVKERLTSPPRAALILLVDQLEEIFTDARHTAPEARVAFLQALDVLARSGVVWVLGTLRSAFVPQLKDAAGSGKLEVESSFYQLGPPDENELSQMIRYPARAAGLEFETAADGAKLDDVLAAAVRRGRDALALLEFTLDELYRQRKDDTLLTHDAYQQLGGLEGALGRKAESVYAELYPGTDETVPVFRSIFRALATTGSGEKETVIRRVAPVDRLASSDERKRFIDAFVEARLFVTASGAEGESVQVAHEALFEHWPRLSQLLEEERPFLRRRARAAAQSALWAEQGRDPSYCWWNGAPLAEARALAAEPDDLSTLELEFVQASLKEAERQRRKRKLVAACAVLFLSVAVWVGWPRDTATEVRRRKLADLHEQLQTARGAIAESFAKEELAGASPLPGVEVEVERVDPLKAQQEAAAQSLALAEIARLILELEPRDSAGWAARVETLLAEKELLAADQALGEWERAVAPNQPAALHDLRARRQWLDGQKETAIELWEKYRQSPGLDRASRLRVLSILAAAYADLENWELCRQRLDEWIELDDNVAARVRRAEAYAAEGQWKKADDDMRAAIGKSAKAPIVLERLPKFERRRRFIKKLDELTAQLEAAPQSRALLAKRAMVFVEAGEFALAVRDLDEVLKTAPNAALPAVQRAFALWLDGSDHLDGEPYAMEGKNWERTESDFLKILEPDEAMMREIGSLDEKLRKEPGSVAALNERGKKLHDIGQHKLALRDFEQAQSLDSNSEAAVVGALDNLWHLERFEDGLVLAAGAVGKHPRSPSVWDFKGRLHQGKEEPQPAVEAYSRAIALRPTAALFRSRAECERALGREAQAAADEARAEKLSDANDSP